MMVFFYAVDKEERKVFYNPLVADKSRFENFEKKGYEFLTFTPTADEGETEYTVFSECPTAGGNKIVAIPTLSTFQPSLEAFHIFNPNGNLLLTKYFHTTVPLYSTFTGRQNGINYAAYHSTFQCAAAVNRRFPQVLAKYQNLPLTVIPNCYTDIIFTKEKRVEIPLTSRRPDFNPEVFTFKADFVGYYRNEAEYLVFLIREDLAALRSTKKIEEKQIVLWKKTPECMKVERIVGAISSTSSEGYVLASPIPLGFPAIRDIPGREIYGIGLTLPRVVVTGVKFQFSGVSSGLQEISFDRQLSYATFLEMLPTGQYGIILMQRAWLFRGTAKPGDSGAPIFAVSGET